MKKLLMITILMLIGMELYSQNESGVRNISKNARVAGGEWFDSTNAMFQVKYPIIRSIPPLSTGMPVNILLYYVYLDSLLRFTSFSQTDDIINNFTTLNDTLKGAANVLYQLKDYNPIIFAQYAAEVSHYRRRALNDTLEMNAIYSNGYRTDTATTQYPRYPKYLNNLLFLSDNIAVKTKDNLPDTLRNSIFAMLFSDYILKIKVLSIDSMPNLLIADPADRDYRYRVTAEVLDTLKGKVFNSTLININPTMINHDNESTIQTSTIIKFEYIKRNYMPGATFYKDKARTQIINEDPTFLKDYGFNMNVDQEAIVFLIHHNQKVDFSYDYFNLDICAASSYCALPIINSNVRDINNFWSSTTLQSYGNWKNIYNNLKSKIINMTY
jgi:hypothetical protein